MLKPIDRWCVSNTRWYLSHNVGCIASTTYSLLFPAAVSASASSSRALACRSIVPHRSPRHCVCVLSLLTTVPCGGGGVFSDLWDWKTICFKKRFWRHRKTGLKEFQNITCVYVTNVALFWEISHNASKLSLDPISRAAHFSLSLARIEWFLIWITDLHISPVHNGRKVETISKGDIFF